MERRFQIGCICVVLLACLLACGCTTSSETSIGDATATPTISEPESSLLVYCGAGMREPMDEIAALFTEREGIGIDYTYGGSAQLLSQIELYQNGDCYMPGAKSYIDSAIEKGFVDKTEPVVYHVLGIAVPKGNPAGITSLEDLTKEGVRVAIGEPTGPAVGQAAKKMLEKDGLWEGVEANTVVKSGTVNELLVYISMNQADAAIIWEDLYNAGTMELIDIPIEEGFVKVVPIGTLTFSENPENAEKYMNFVASDEGLSIFRKHGFVTYPDPKYGN
jgi:molybdate transport system substrate-binding protein